MNWKVKFHLLLSISFLLWVSCSSTKSNSELVHLNSFLGPQKSQALDALAESFDIFLDLNFPDESTKEQTAQFLNYLDQSTTLYDSSWKLESQGKSVLERVEESGLRKEIFLFGYETYEVQYDIGELLDKLLPVDKSKMENLDRIDLDTQKLDLWIEDIEIPDVNWIDTTWRETNTDSLWTYNIYGQFLYGLLKCSSDTNVWRYCDARYSAGDINPHLVVRGFQVEKQSFDNPIYQRIIAIDLYYHILEKQIEQNESLNK